ncbi:hypothetical protein [Pseudemcibacter aquimaris]|uniref:hypothetical protein n=1 Tax=Pseudemcibacter aquimaris TaxID=2857064 RepID=UPI00201130AA|nr:hypothetical protein [Pseudemcibacter aquimaris]MCC3862266.1 hypothetical protein [Pseudemcibacter aquimaris]WDU59016.1 hypothetical protein KW060_01865 [Pseudemcibacter aquimaris]
MRLIFISLSLLLLAACTPKTEVVETAPPAPEAAPEPVVAAAPKPAEPRFRMDTILGLETGTVEQILGVPSLRRVEKDAEVWLYDNQFCNAHVYFYENDNSDLHVEFIETSEEKNLAELEGQHADFCISTFLQD